MQAREFTREVQTESVTGDAAGNRSTPEPFENVRLRIGRNCLIAADVIERDFSRFLSSNGHVANELASGETVDVATSR